jgi:hypothetical protein
MSCQTYKDGKNGRKYVTQQGGVTTIRADWNPFGLVVKRLVRAIETVVKAKVCVKISERGWIPRDVVHKFIIQPVYAYIGILVGRLV